MRILSLFFVVVTVNIALKAQSINYTIPAGYEKDISKEDYKKLVDIAVPVVSARYSIGFVKDGTIQLKKGQDLGAVNLHNLILKCVAEKDKSLWKEIIQGHFDNIFSSIDEQKKIDPANYETIKKY